MQNDAIGSVSTTDNDIALVQRIVQGERQAFEVLMRRFNQRLYRLARVTLRSDSDARDALQDAYLNIYRSIYGFRGDASLATWLSRVVLNECLARQRRSQRRENVIPMLSAETHMNAVAAVVDASESPDTALDREQMRDVLEHKVNELPETFRIVFVLRSVEDLSVEETALVLNIPEETVRSRHFRARSLLRESLAREVDMAEPNLFEFDGARCDSIVADVLTRLDGKALDDDALEAPGEYSSPACYSHEFKD